MTYSFLIWQLEKIVKSIQKELLEENGRHYEEDYTGLCDAVWDKLEKKIDEWNHSYIAKNIHNGQFIPFHLHGELKHTAKINPDNWVYQHTWYAVVWKQNNSNEYCIPPKYEKLIFIDPTIKQFQWLFTDLPDYYVYPTPPKWFYWDRYNPAFVGIKGWWINTRCKNIIHLLLELEDENRSRKNIPEWWQNFILFIQHDIKRNIYKAYRWLIGRREDGY